MTKKKRGNMTDGHARQSMARDDTVGIIGFLQRDTEKERKREEERDVSLASERGEALPALGSKTSFKLRPT